MKVKNINKHIILFILAIFGISTSCDDEFLEPDPQSFYTPENSLNSAEGMKALLFQAMNTIRAEFYGDGMPLITENIFSEVAVEGTTDKSGPAQDLNLLILPDANLNSANTNRIGWYWDEFYEAIKYTNTVISRIDDAEYDSDAERDEILGLAYFYRAYFYYRLVHQFGDVPAIMTEIREPRLDFRSNTRRSILEKIKSDLEFAEGAVPYKDTLGEANKGAVLHLLTKVNLALGEFADAITSSSSLINSGQYALVTNRFGVDLGDATKNVTWDLHQAENKSVPANTEAILNIISRLDFPDGSGPSTSIMRQAVPLWWRFINTPTTGSNGMSDNPGIEIDQVFQFGRGIGRNRGVPYSTQLIWSDPTDERHLYPNWMRMEDLVYNAPSLKTAGDPDYGQNLQLTNGVGTVLCSDTIRNWYAWPYYKLYVDDPTAAKPSGGYSDWYVFRLAETYLLRAEAHFWNNDPASAADDINMVRQRANAADMLPGEVNIGTILDERARELYYEEPRNTELTRIAFILAQTGRTAYNGKSYTLSNFHTENFWYDRIMESTFFYNKGVKTIHGDEYTMSPYHSLYPVPASAINANTQGRINQNLGYPGAEKNVEPLTTIEE